VLLDGARRSRDGLTQRHRFRCVPVGNERPHRFTPILPARRSADHFGHDDECTACDRPFRPGEGARTAPRFTFTLRELAEAFVRVGRGGSYRGVSGSLRAGIHKTSRRGRKAGWTSSAPNLVISYLDAIAPVVIEPLAATEWSPAIALDAWPIRVRTHPARKPLILPFGAKAPPSRSQVREVGRVLAAVGYDRPFGQPKALLLRFAGGGDEASWATFLRSLPGVPNLVVSDRDQAIGNAVRQVWGDHPVIYFSEHHLTMNIQEVARKDGVAEDSDLWTMLIQAQWSDQHMVAAWQEAHEMGAHRVVSWFDLNADLLRGQVTHRIPGWPRSAAATEHLLTQTAKALNDRRHLFRNADRLDRTLALIRAEVAKVASESVYTRLLRDYVIAHDGELGAEWRGLLDPAGISSMEVMVTESQARIKSIRAPRKSARMLSRRAAAKEERAAAGLLPVPRGKPQKIPAKGSVRGKTVADFPWLVREWHPTRNDELTPDQVPAGSGDIIWWRCPDDDSPEHEWQSQVRSRTIRGSRCPFCTNRIVAASDSLAVTHPDLARQWHPTRNGHLTPDKVTHGSHTHAWWICPTYKSHLWRARISSRTSMLSGCPTCATKRGKGGRPKGVVESQPRRKAVGQRVRPSGPGAR